MRLVVLKLQRVLGVLRMLFDKPEWVTHANGIYSLDLSQDNTRVVTGGGDEKVRVWSLAPMLTKEPDASSTRVLATLSDHFGPVNVVRFSPDGKHIASGSDDRLCIVYRLDPNGTPKQTFGSKDPPPVECWKVKSYVASCSFVGLVVVASDTSVQVNCVSRYRYPLVGQCTI